MKLYTIVDMRRRWPRLLLAAVLGLSLLIFIKYEWAATGVQEKYDPLKRNTKEKRLPEQEALIGVPRKVDINELNFKVKGNGQSTPSKDCSPTIPAKTLINTVNQFSKFDFQPPWVRGREFWDASFEKRYLQRRVKWRKLPLKVILMPHSHTDPGWLKTFEEYYFHQVSNIIANMIEKLTTYPSLTFVWSEISYLSLWYDRAHPSLREKLKELVKSGRLEVLTGGWVMTDEANAHLYAMVTQLIEGHQWLQNTLGVKPQNGWSIDVFGHGAAVPYLLKESGINNTVIQRIHFIWKQWLAERQYGDFIWRQGWDNPGDTDILVHNRPYDIYSIKHSCGPHPQICLNFDFRKIVGEYTEYSIKATNIDDRNIHEKADQLLEEYGRTASLYPHNVVLVPIGDDFRYDHSTEWDQQFKNYNKLLEYVNNNKSYNAEIQFGTLKDYFKAVHKRTKSFPTLQGDFFVYSDIFTDGRPAYWSGYFTTRPYWKLLSRQLEGVLHTTEAFYTLALNQFPGSEFKKIQQILQKDYDKLIKARRGLSLFQHHDAITGTSKSFVMHDYALKLHEGYQEALSILGHTAFALLATESILLGLKNNSSPFDYIQPSTERVSYDKWPRSIPIEMNAYQRLIVLTNSLGQRRNEMAKVVVKSTEIRITDQFGHDVPFQINPIWNRTSDGMVIVPDKYEIFFIANLPPLSMVVYTIHHDEKYKNTKNFATIYSNYYGDNMQEKNSSPFTLKDIIPGDVQIENNHLKLIFDGMSGMIYSITRKETGSMTHITQQYGSYPSAQFRSGAYLFKPDYNEGNSDDDVLSGSKAHIFIHSGPISSEFTVMFGSVLLHSYRIFHVEDEPYASSVYMENSFNLNDHYNKSETPGFTAHFRQTELFFRFKTDIRNGDVPTFYTDQGGLNMQKREKVERIGIEGNYFPITSATYIEDDKNVSQRKRFTIIVDHAAGAASWKQGWLEVMIDRRTLYDDARGMGEGVTDQKRTLCRYWLILEDVMSHEQVPRLSLAAHHLSNGLNVPAQILSLEGLPSSSLKPAAYIMTRPLPCSLHVLSLRTISETDYPSLIPSSKALLTIQNQPSSCSINSVVNTCRGFETSVSSQTNFTIPVTSMYETSLTGIHTKQRLFSLSNFTVPDHKVKSLLVEFFSEP